MNMMEGLAVATAIEEQVEASVLSARDLRAGQIHKGPIIAVESWGVLVQLGDDAKALVTNMHLADASVKDARSRFRVGAKVTCKLLTVEKDGRKVHATMKKSLVQETGAPLLSYAEAAEAIAGNKKGRPSNRVVVGFVTKIVAAGVVVTFFNNVNGLISAAMLARQGVEDMGSSFNVGQIVKSTILRVIPATNDKPTRLFLALDVPRTANDEDKKAEPVVDEPSGPEVPVGALVSGIVAKRDTAAAAITIDLEGEFAGRQATLGFAHLGDFARLSVRRAETDEFAVGAKVADALVIKAKTGGKKKGIKPCEVTLKPLLLAAYNPKAPALKQDNTDAEPSPIKLAPWSSEAVVGDSSTSVKISTPRVFEEVRAGMVVAGYVRGVEPFGVFVQFANGLSGMVPRAQIADRFVDDAAKQALFAPGDSIVCVVQRVDAEQSRVVLTTKPRLLPCGFGSNRWLGTLLR